MEIAMRPPSRSLAATALVACLAVGLSATLYMTARAAEPALDAATAASAPGVLQTTLTSPAGSAIDAAIWYPADAGGTPVLFAKNPVFVGVPARDDAPVTAGKHPLILVSHGLGGNFRSISWLASGLAARGAIVIAVNHPGSNTFDFDIARGMQHWTRAADLTGVTDTILADPRFGPLIDTTRISAAGFSYGGFTALSVGGLRGNLAGYAAHCAATVAVSTHCADLADAGIDLTTYDADQWNASHRDPRITRVAAIEPGLIWGLTPADVADLTIPTLLISLGTGADRLFETDIDASGLTALLPAASHVTIAPARHYSALATCTPDGAAILADEGEPPICTDPAGADRDAVHAQMITSIADFLDL
jgi:predicted dienelactone hydrolase